MRAAYLRCKAVAEGSSGAWCALLCGDYGVGKTHLAVAAMNAFDGSSYFWKVPEFLAWLRRWAFDEGWAIERLTRSYREDRFLLVLDDLGAENPTEWAGEQLYWVLDARYERRLPTILTTNVGIDRLDGRIRARFAAGIVACNGRNLHGREGST